MTWDMILAFEFDSKDDLQNKKSYLCMYIFCNCYINIILILWYKIRYCLGFWLYSDTFNI